jgi:hypothetical protein
MKVLGKTKRISSKPVIWEHHGQCFDCVYSPDDGGYYLQRHSDDAVSEVCQVPGQLWERLVENEIKWTN